jgi:predicted RNA binding protein YcfA (HicA-like mRNA interferase family)
VIRHLNREGWVLVSTEGSHRQFKHSTKPGRVTVSGSLSDDMPKGTLASVKRQAGLKGVKS